MLGISLTSFDSIAALTINSKVFRVKEKIQQTDSEQS